ncbi:serine hydrolase FSH [Xylariaceae sp. FL0255]|nr:serine hydrolase FSH [Xylariaceae sp. FL0255]
MATAAETNGAEAAASDKRKTGKKELKILMLHGFTQSGPLFSAKTKALSKLLTKYLPDLKPTLIFPSGPHRLRPSDIPGYAGPDEPSDDELDNWAWFRRDDATNEYRGLEAGMATVSSAIAEAGGIDGVIGFSQGGCMAALVAAALEVSHQHLHTPSSPSPPLPSDPSNWLPALRAANNHNPIEFAVIYSGFWAIPDNLQGLYTPPIHTPTMHFIGGLDTVVEESRSQKLIDRCWDPFVVTHPGGHYVPVAREWVERLVGWLRGQFPVEKNVKNSL